MTEAEKTNYKKETAQPRVVIVGGGFGDSMRHTRSPALPLRVTLIDKRMRPTG